MGPGCGKWARRSRCLDPWLTAGCGLQENCAILKELVALRAQKSSLLGFSTHADYVLEMNMAKTSQTVASFLGNCPIHGLASGGLLGPVHGCCL